MGDDGLSGRSASAAAPAGDPESPADGGRALPSPPPAAGADRAAEGDTGGGPPAAPEEERGDGTSAESGDCDEESYELGGKLWRRLLCRDRK